MNTKNEEKKIRNGEINIIEENDTSRARIHAMIDQLGDEQLAGLEPMLAMLAGNSKTE